MPVVTLFAAFAGVWGGELVAVSVAGITPDQYWQSARAMPIADLMLGLSKTFVFGLIIALVGCWQGLRARGGAAGVGRSTTAAVVISTVLVYIANYYLAELLFGNRSIEFY